MFAAKCHACRTQAAAYVTVATRQKGCASAEAAVRWLSAPRFCDPGSGRDLLFADRAVPVRRNAGESACLLPPFRQAPLRDEHGRSRGHAVARRALPDVSGSDACSAFWSGRQSWRFRRSVRSPHNSSRAPARSRIASPNFLQPLTPKTRAARFSLRLTRSL